MASFYSTQMALILGNTVPDKIKMQERGVMRVARWTYTTPASGAPGTSDTLYVCRLPLGAILLGGKTAAEAMSSAGGTAGYDIGYAGATNRYGNDIDIDAAGEDFFGNTIALNYMDELTAEQDIIVTPTGETWAVSSKFYGEFHYMLQ